MYKIYIDTAERTKKEITLVKSNDVIECIIDETDVVTAIANLLKKHALTPQDIEEYIPNTGPGSSFTGIKVGVVIANTLNWALGKKRLQELAIPNYGKEPNIQTPNSPYKVLK